jgi:hypothetical protein
MASAMNSECSAYERMEWSGKENDNVYCTWRLASKQQDEEFASEWGTSFEWHESVCSKDDKGNIYYKETKGASR